MSGPRLPRPDLEDEKKKTARYTYFKGTSEEAFDPVDHEAMLDALLDLAARVEDLEARGEAT